MEEVSVLSHEEKLEGPNTNRDLRRSALLEMSFFDSKEGPGRETTRTKGKPVAIPERQTKGRKGKTVALIRGPGRSSAEESVNRLSTAEYTASIAELHKQKQALKQAMRNWEVEFEEKNGGLVPTHHDKRENEQYRDMKVLANRHLHPATHPTLPYPARPTLPHSTSPTPPHPPHPGACQTS